MITSRLPFPVSLNYRDATSSFASYASLFRPVIKSELHRMYTMVSYPRAHELQEIDAGLSVDVFNQQAYSALKKHGGFVLTNLDKAFTEGVERSFSEYDTFRKNPISTLKKFYGVASFPAGYYPDGSYMHGSKVGPRYFINSDATGKPLHHVYPTLQAAALSLVPFRKKIIAMTVAAMQSGLNPKSTNFSGMLEGYTTIMGMHHYQPITQEKLRRWNEHRQVTKTEDGRIEAFLGHADLSVMSVLIYRENCAAGLEVELKNEVGDYRFYPVNIDKNKSFGLRAVIILGRMSETLTNGLLKGVSHRVIAEPMAVNATSSRDAINFFIYVGRNKTLQPIVPVEASAQHCPTTVEAFLASWVETYLNDAKTYASTISDADLKPFPKEQDLESREEQSGRIVYKRIR